MDGGSFGSLGAPPPGDGGGAPSDGSTTAGSILTTTTNNQESVSEVSSPYPLVVVGGGGGDENLELGLGLSIGGFGGLRSKGSRILTTEDFGCLISKDSSQSSSSSTSSSCFKKPNLSICGTKRLASDFVSPSSVVGWPPIRKGHRLPNQAKLPDEQSSSTAEGNKSIGNGLCSQTKKGVANKSYLPVKVNMDGSLIGRKVDLNTHGSYETLAQTLENMFCQRWSTSEASGPSKLLDETSEFVLTYEDKDGDCMLVGDVPWPMFLGSVKRLRIIRNFDSNKPSPKMNATRRTTTDDV